MRALLLLAGSVIGIIVASRAAAQDAPTEPPAPPNAPSEVEPPQAAPEPPPPAAPAEPAPPAAPADPPAPAPVPPPPPPAPVAPPQPVAPAPVTLEETPEAPPAAKPSARPRKKAPAAEEPAKPTREEPPPPAVEPPKTAERTPRATPPGEAPPEEGEDGRGPENEDDEKDDDGDGVLGPFRIGPIVGVGLPSIVSFGGIIKITRYLGAGLNIGLIPAIKVSLYGDAELSYQEYDIYGRLFPFGGMVFVGAGVGYATMEGTFKVSAPTTAYQNLNPPPPNPLTISSDASVKTMVLTPTIGLLHTFGSGFTLGIDVGAQVPIAPSTKKYKTTVPAVVAQQQAFMDQYVTPNDEKVQDTLDTVGRTILPTLNLRVGWLL